MSSKPRPPASWRIRAPKSLWLVKGTLAPSNAKEATSSDEGLDSSGFMVSGKHGSEFGTRVAQDFYWARHAGKSLQGAGCSECEISGGCPKGRCRPALRNHRPLSPWRREAAKKRSAASWPIRISSIRAISISVIADPVSPCCRFSIFARNSSWSSS